MKLLMITRKIDPDEGLAGFVYDWTKAIGSSLEELFVITWQPSLRGKLPDNIKVFSLPENKFFKIFKLQKYLWQILPQVDGVFCHMNPEYTILSYLLAKFYKKKIISWYTHSAVSWRLKLMEKCADKILTASALSFRLPSKKVIVTGHGINLEKFFAVNKPNSGLINILTVGRISPTKDYESMIKAVDKLVDQGLKNIKLTIVGEAGLKSHQIYLDNLKQMVGGMKLEGVVEFRGAVSNNQIPQILQQSDLFLNLSGTGSLDKAVLEAMACGCLVLTSNEAFKTILPAELLVQKNNPAALAEKIKWVVNLSEAEKGQLVVRLQDEVRLNHNLEKLAKKIISEFENV